MSKPLCRYYGSLIDSGCQRCLYGLTPDGREAWCSADWSEGECSYYEPRKPTKWEVTDCIKQILADKGIDNAEIEVEEHNEYFLVTRANLSSQQRASLVYDSELELSNRFPTVKFDFRFMPGDRKGE